MSKRWFAIALVCVTLGTACASARPGDEGFFDSFTTLNKSRWMQSIGWTNGDHQGCEWTRDALKTGEDGLQLELSDRGGKTRPYGCPEISTYKRLGYGMYEARMRVAAGSGLNTAFFTYIGPPNGVPEHDEIDFEFLGKDTHFVSPGYFADGKGGPQKPVPLGFDAAADFHDYAIEWTPLKIRWFVDGKLLVETHPGETMPLNPGKLFFSLWSGTPVENDWMGPFTYSGPSKAAVQWTGYTPAGETCLFPQSITCKMPK